MAVIAGNYDPNNPNQTQQPAQGTATPSTGSTAPTQPVQQKTPSSGFQNFNQYAQANQQSGQRIGNLLSSNVQQQAKTTQASTEAGNVGNAVQAEKDRIQQGVNKVQQAVTGNQGFGSFFQNENASAPEQVNQNLSSWANQLATGQTNKQQLQTQSQAAYNTANQQLADLNTKANLLGTEGGRFQFLQNILGKSGNYNTPASRLDQALFQTNTKQLSDVLNASNQAAQSQNQLLQQAQTNTQQQLNDLTAAAAAGKQQVVDLSQQGLSDLDKALVQQQSDAINKRTADIDSIRKQMATEHFSQDTANQLGIGRGTTLFNILKGNAGKYVSEADPNAITKQNVIDANELQKYAALQKMLGQDTGSFQYKDIGKVDPSYTLQGDQFKKDLAALYNQRADQAAKDTIVGHGSDTYESGWDLFGGTQYSRTNQYTGANVSNMIDPNQLRQAAQTFQAMSAPSQTVTGPTQSDWATTGYDAQRQAQVGGAQALANAPAAILTQNPAAVIPGALNFAEGMFSGLLNQLNAFGNDRRGGAERAAKRNSITDLQNKWNQYLQNQGYSDTAYIDEMLNPNGEGK